MTQSIAKPALTQVPIDSTIAQRWSGRSYDSQQMLNQDQTIALIEAARWAPSCMGDQPWRFVVCDKGQHPEAWQKAYNCLSEGNQVWVKNAPWICIVCADSVFIKNGQANRWAQYDTGAAALNLCLQASSMGLVAHQLGGFDAQQARQLFAIPEQFTLMAMIAVGYPAAPDLLSEELRQRELAPRARKPLADIAFAGDWQNALV